MQLRMGGAAAVVVLPVWSASMLADPMRCVRCFSPLLTGCCDVLLLMLLCMCLRTLSCKAQII